MDKPVDAPQPQSDAGQPAVACGNCRRALPGPTVPVECPFCGTAQSYKGWTVLKPTLPDLGTGGLLSKVLRVFRLAPRPALILLGLQILINIVVTLAQQAASPAITSAATATDATNNYSSLFLLVDVLVAVVNIGIIAALTKIWTAVGTVKPLIISEGVEEVQREFVSYIGAFLLAGIFWIVTIIVAAIVIFIPAAVASSDTLADIGQKLNALGPNDPIPMSLLEQALTGPIIAAIALLLVFLIYAQIRFFGVLFPILALERVRNMEAVRRNWAMTRGRTGLVYFILALVTLVPTALSVFVPLYVSVSFLPPLISGLIGAYLTALGFALYIEARRKGA